MEYLLYFLILFPFLSAVLLKVNSNFIFRKIITYISSVAIIGVSVAFTVLWALNGSVALKLVKNTEYIDYIILFCEYLIMVIVTVIAINYKKYLIALLSIVQTLAITWFELVGSKALPYYKPAESTHLYIDHLTVIMILIIAVVGTLITVYACGYMKDYHKHHKEYKDRSSFFFSMMYVFLGAMFGLVCSSNLSWMYFFWEITSLISFLLIGYTRTPEAIKNSFRALWMNLLGGLGFCAAIIWLGYSIFSIYDLQTLLAIGKHYDKLFIIPVAFLAFAALTKSAQLPFSKWLLGAMVAPTPSSALLHSATMVKAGVYLLLRLSPVMAGNNVGNMVTLIGGFTFLDCSMFAVANSDGKKVLAYSTISNLGLITACAGVGRNETVWAAILLLIFHAVSKALLFQTVGTVENKTGSRDIEDMHGLITRQSFLAYALVIGIAGMFLAPFGMLISKWAALKAFIDEGNIISVFFICFGSATTLFYWAKWLCKILSYKPHSKKIENPISKNQKLSIFTHVVLMVLLCFAFPIVSDYLLLPYIAHVFGSASNVLGGTTNIAIMIIMVFSVFLVPLIVGIISEKLNFKQAAVYFNGVNTGDELHFVDSMGEEKKTYMSNWYLKDIFGEKKLWNPSIAISVVVLVAFMVITVGGAL